MRPTESRDSALIGGKTPETTAQGRTYRAYCGESSGGKQRGPARAIDNQSASCAISRRNAKVETFEQGQLIEDDAQIRAPYPRSPRECPPPFLQAIAVGWVGQAGPTAHQNRRGDSHSRPSVCSVRSILPPGSPGFRHAQNSWSSVLTMPCPRGGEGMSAGNAATPLRSTSHRSMLPSGPPKVPRRVTTHSGDSHAFSVQSTCAAKAFMNLVVVSKSCRVSPAIGRASREPQ